MDLRRPSHSFVVVSLFLLMCDSAPTDLSDHELLKNLLSDLDSGVYGVPPPLPQGNEKGQVAPVVSGEIRKVQSTHGKRLPLLPWNKRLPVLPWNKRARPVPQLPWNKRAHPTGSEAGEYLKILLSVLEDEKHADEGNQLSSSADKRLMPLPPDKRLPSLPPNKRIPELPMDKRLPALPMDKRLPALPMDKRLPALPMDKRLPALPMDKRLPALPMDKRLPALPMDKRLPALPMDKRLPALPMDKRLPALPMDKRLPALPMDKRLPELPMDKRLPALPMDKRLPVLPWNKRLSELQSPLYKVRYPADLSLHDRDELEMALHKILRGLGEHEGLEEAKKRKRLSSMGQFLKNIQPGYEFYGAE